jgi:ATP-binding cassette subfamily F protein uup
VGPARAAGPPYKSKEPIEKLLRGVASDGYETDAEVELILPPAPPFGSRVLNLKNTGIALGGTQLFSSLNFNFERHRKLGVIGRNGLGKTTLLRIILGQLQPGEGHIDVGDKTVFNYVDQSRLALTDENTVLQEIGDGREWIMFGEERLTVWNYLRRFLFTDDRINTKVEKLSGGERSRLLLAKILMNGGNFLILDEPTNDLDLATLRVLEEALVAFEGCVIIVSHDRCFLNRVCNGIMAFEGEGKVHFSEGDYDYYFEKKELRAAADVPPDIPAKIRGTTSRSQAKGLKWKEEREIESIERAIVDAEAEVERLEAIFSAPDFYQKRGEQINQLTAELDTARATVDRLYTRWNELEELKTRLS